MGTCSPYDPKATEPHHVSLPCARRVSRAAAVSLAAVTLAVAAPGFAQRARDLAAPRLAEVAPRDHDRDFGLDIAADILLPLAVGGRVTLQVPGGILIHVVAGLVPTFMTDAVNDVGTGWGAWNADDARVARTLLDNATVLEFGVGIRPAGTPGLELSVGYLLVWSHVMTSPGALWGGTNPLDESGGRGRLGIDLTIDAIHAELAWQTVLLDHLCLRVSVGWVHGFRETLSLTTDGRSASQTEVRESVERSLEQEVSRRAFGPSVGVALGVRLE